MLPDTRPWTAMSLSSLYPAFCSIRQHAVMLELFPPNGETGSGRDVLADEP